MKTKWTKDEVIDQIDDCIAHIRMNQAVKSVMLNAKDLLKEQKQEREAIKPTINEYGEAFCICGENVGIIPRSKNLPSIRSKYCSECGRQMKWNK